MMPQLTNDIPKAGPSGSLRQCGGAIVASLIALLAAVASTAPATSVRIAAWSLPPRPTPSSATNDTAISRAADALGQFAPDVILLKGARDWQTCARLARDLGAGQYKVLVCSSIRDPRTGKPAEAQVAILAKRTAYFSWADDWKSQTNGTSGYAFAAIQFERERLGFFAVQLDPALENELETYDKSKSTGPQPQVLRDWLQAVDSFKQWTANRLDALVIAGAFDAGPPAKSRVLLQARLAEAFLGAPLEQPVRWVNQDGTFGIAPEHVLARVEPDQATPPGLVLTRFPITCELDLAPGSWPALRPPQMPEGAVAAAPASSAPDTKILPSTWSVILPWAQWTALGAGGAAVLVIAAWLRGRRQRPVPSPALLGRYAESSQLPTSSYTVILAPLPTTSSSGEPGPPPQPQPVVLLEKPGVTQTQSLAWQQRALAAEKRAERAHQVIRRGLIPHLRAWLKQKVLHQIVTERTQLLQTQDATVRTVIEVDERLARIEAQIEQQIREHQRRIEELSRELIAAKEENRELIRERIAQIRSEMEATRARMLAQANQEPE
jgi:hypothetical protein